MAQKGRGIFMVYVGGTERLVARCTGTAFSGGMHAIGHHRFLGEGPPIGWLTIGNTSASRART
jgi:hypothetical protein